MKLKSKLRAKPCSFTYLCSTSILLFPVWSLMLAAAQSSTVLQALWRKEAVTLLTFFSEQNADKYFPAECSYKQCFHTFSLFSCFLSLKRENDHSTQNYCFSVWKILSIAPLKHLHAAKSNYGTHPLFKENISAEDYCLSFLSLPGQPSSTFSKYLPMDFISDVATMLKCYLINFFIVCYSLLLVLKLKNLMCYKLQKYISDKIKSIILISHKRMVGSHSLCEFISAVQCKY